MSLAEAQLFIAGEIYNVGNAFVATLLDLVDKNIFKINENSDEVYLTKTNKTTDLKGHEKN